MILIITIVIAFLLYGILLLFFWSLGFAAKRGDEMLNKNEFNATEQPPEAQMSLDLSKSVEETKRIFKKYQNTATGQPENFKSSPINF